MIQKGVTALREAAKVQIDRIKEDYLTCALDSTHVRMEEDTRRHPLQSLSPNPCKKKKYMYHRVSPLSLSFSRSLISFSSLSSFSFPLSLSLRHKIKLHNVYMFIHVF